MRILVFNSGSSSLKFKLYRRAGALEVRISGAVSNFGEHAEWSWQSAGQTTTGRTRAHGHGEAALWVLRRLRDEGSATIEAIGHRVVHGGEEFRQPTLLTADAMARLEALSPLAPLHNPLALEVIRACRAELGEPAPIMVAVFDTAFHATLPESARHYALPDAWVRTYGIRRYGFHGIAHQYMYERYLALTAKEHARVVTFQLGHGCSVAAIRAGRSADTSMGYTPLEGLIMATRCGDTDPGAIVRLAAAGLSAAEIDDRLNRASGLLALSGTGDMRSLLAREAAGDGRARLALDAFCHRARKYLGAYLAVLGGADAVLFGGGIGEHAPAIRARICADMDWCGLRLDPGANAAAGAAERRVSAAGTQPAVYVISVDEESLIARQVAALLERQGA